MAAGLGQATGGALVIAVTAGATISGIAKDGPIISGDICGARRSLRLGRLSRFEIEIIECLQDYFKY